MTVRSSSSLRIPIHNVVGVWLWTARSRAAAVITFVAALACAPAAIADSTSSSNWAGYAVHRSGTTFHTVQGTWRQPSATCTPGLKTYSSYWVGLGGYSKNSAALEQIGTEVDCTAAGQVRSTAWYELVPSPSVPVKLTVAPGDLLTAAVTVTGSRVSLSLRDLTSRNGFVKTITASRIDATSAEWVVEAPSDCVNANLCQTLPLANFGSAEFDSALAASTKGHIGAIADGSWDTTKISLMPQGTRFFIGNAAPSSLGGATPSALGAGGHSFKVAYSPITSGSRFQAKRGAELRAGYLLHPGR